MKKVVAIILTAVMLICLLSACANTESSGKEHTGGNKTPTTETTQPTETTPPVSTYKQGNWTTSGYTSEWLNLSYKPPLYLQIKSDSIDIDRQFYALKLKEDPYVAVSEMRFERSTDTSNSIKLYVTLLENNNLTAQQHAQSYIKETQNTYKSLGADYKVLAEHNAEISFLGEEYFVQYTKYTAFGKTREECILFLVKDGYLVKIWYSGLSQYFVLEDTFSGFSALNGEDTSITCDGCSCDVNYQVLSTSTPVCLECYFTGAYPETESNTVTPPAQSNALTLDNFLTHLNSLEDGVTNLKQTNIEGLENTISVSCNFYWDYFHLNATAENDIVRHIYVSVLPSALMDSGAFSNLDEAKVAAYGLAVDPLMAINKDWDSGWHSQQLLSAPEEGDASTSIRNYQQGDWSFSVMIGNALVSVSAINSGTTTPTQPEETTPQTTPTQAPTQKPTQTPAQKPTQTPTQKPTQAPCSHTYKDATCTAPKTCTKCGATSGSALPHTWKDATCTAPATCSVCGTTTGNANGHMWKNATCTTPKTCSVCGTTTGDVAAHTWKDATCTAPATCTTCKKTSGKAKGHTMDITECVDCGHTDFSPFAKTYSYDDIGVYEELIEAGCDVTSVSIDKDGTLTFVCMGNTYTVTLVQTYSDYYTGGMDVEFDCYQDGVLLTDAEAWMVILEEDEDDEYGGHLNGKYILHLRWNYFEGYKLYFNVEGYLDI